MWTRWSLRGRAQCLRGQIGVSESRDIGWLRLGLRARRHRNERIRRPLAHRGRSAQPAGVPRIAGGSGLSPEVLRQTVRERLANDVTEAFDFTQAPREPVILEPWPWREPEPWPSF